MSWPPWPGAAQPPVVAAAAPLLNPAPAVIPPYATSDQWTQMQQQNWQQWAQWQQQYQQWHQQYGAEYQKSMSAFAAQQQPTVNIGVPPPLPVEPQPPLPKDDIPKPAPPLPVPAPPSQQVSMSQYSTQPPMPNQFSAPPPSFGPNAAQQQWKANAGTDQKRPLVGKEDPVAKRQMMSRQGWQSAGTAHPLPNGNEELSEAEKKFDKQFAEWEAQFNKWKEQNSGHPDKQQYKEYEKKWETWRQQLLDRREAMRRKRLGLPPLKAPTSNQPTQSFNVPPPAQNPSGQLATSATSESTDTAPSTMFNKPPPDMNNEPLQFKGADKESESQEGGLGFLNTTKSDGIPGLDLVKDGDMETIDDEEEPTPIQRGPDLEAISKGINNILGDPKLMNMLSMVTQNQGANLNNFQKVVGDASSSRDQSNMSGEDTRNEHPEPIQNFDDQTRSSFTMQSNDQEYFNRGSVNNAQFSMRMPPPNYDNESPYSRPPPNFSLPKVDDMNRPPPGRLGGEFDKASPVGPDGFGRRSTGLLPDPGRKGVFGMEAGGGRDDFGDNDFDQANSDRHLESRPPFGRDSLSRNNHDRSYNESETLDRDGRPIQNTRFAPGFRSGNDDFNEPPPFNARAGRDDFNRPPPPNFRGGNRNDFNELPPSNFRGNREEFNKPPQLNFRGDRDDFDEPNNFRGAQKNFDGPPPNFRGSADDFNGPPPKFRGRLDDFNEPPQQTYQGARDNFRSGRNDFNEPPPPNIKGDQDDFGGPPPPNFRGGREDFNNQQYFREDRNSFNAPPPPNFRGGNNFRQMDQIGRNFGQGSKSYGENIGGPDGGNFDKRFNRSGPGRFGEDLGRRNDFEDDGEYPPPPQIHGSFGRNDNSEAMAEAPTPPQLNQQQFEEGGFQDMPPDEGLEAEDQGIWKPETVVDYEHKRVKPPEIDVLVQPFRMYDYRHRPLSRIPYPDRPNWLSDAVKMIPEFDPPIIRKPLPVERRMFNDRFEPPPPPRGDWGSFRPDERPKYDRNAYDSTRPPKFDEGEWLSRRRRSRSPLRFERPPSIPERVPWDEGSRPGDRDRRGMNKKWENEDRLRKDRNEFDRERRDDRRVHRDDREQADGWKRRDAGWEDKRKWKNDDMDIESEERRDETLKIDNRNFERESFGRKPAGSVFPFSKPIDESKPSNVTLVEDILNAPGRLSRPQRIVIILRGPPGSGKTYLAKMIKDKEVENGGSTPRILSLDDYFMVEQEKEVMEDGKRVKLKEMVYEFEADMEESYRNSLIKSFKKTITDGYFPFIIVDNVNDKVKYFGEMWSFAKQNGFQVYICQMELDVQNCTKRNIHNRTEDEIRRCIEGWESTPSHHPILDVTSLLQGEPISEVEMEEISSPVSDEDKEDGLEDRLDRSKWDNFDCSINNLARLDGVSKPPRPARTMEEFLQLDDDFEITKPTKPGQKRVRWADLEERKQQEKMRAVGFVVGQTDWGRMMDPSMGESALTQTRFIEKVQRRRF